MVINPKVSTEIDWSALSASDNLDWGAILATFSVGVGKNSLINVRHL